MALRYIPAPLDPPDPPAPPDPPEPRLWTPGRIAESLGVPVHRVQYVVRSRRIRPAARAARLRLFDRPAVDRIAEELGRIDARPPTAPRQGEEVGDG